MFFDRPKYKDFARRQLKGRWGIPVLVTIVTSFIIWLFEIPGYIKIFNNAQFTDFIYGDFESFKEYFDAYSYLVNETSSSVASFVQGFVEVILIMAGLNVYLKMSRSPEKVGFGAFIEGMNNWWKAVLCQLYKGLFILLWFFCFIIPAFIKAYEYSQMEFILAEFSDVSIGKSMEISKKITKGYKWDLFVMDLSFLGWGILCLLSLGIGFIWLRPYMTMSRINAYHAMLKNALESEIITPGDLQ